MTYKKDTTQQMTIGKQYTYEKLKNLQKLKMKLEGEKKWKKNTLKVASAIGS